MFEFNEETRIKDAKDLEQRIKAVSGYIDLEKGDDLIPFSNGYVATLYKGSEKLGAFLIHEHKRTCIKKFYYDEYEECVVCHKDNYGPTLAFENKANMNERIQAFNDRAIEVVNLAKKDGFDIGEAYVIKDLIRFKVKSRLPQSNNSPLKELNNESIHTQ